jgi:hypothetical protein
MKNCYFLFFAFLFVFLFFSCIKPDITPAFLILSEEDFENCFENDRGKFNTTHDANFDETEFQIIRHHHIRDVYVSINGKELGYWRLPCTIPLLPDYSGENIIRIIPCVRTPNATLTTIQYTFVTPVSRFLKIEKEGAYKLDDLIFEYRKEVDFNVVETFTQSTLFSSVDTINNYAQLSIIHEESIGEIILNDSLPIFDIATDYMNLLGINCKHFWEIYYKCDGEMVTYLGFRNTPSGVTHQTMMVFPSTSGSWKKAYIDISEIVKIAASGSPILSVRLGISGIRNSNTSTAYFHFKYVKLISMVSLY